MSKIGKRLAIVSLAIVLCCSCIGRTSAQKTLSSLDDLFTAGKSLESAHHRVGQDQKSDDAERDRLLFLFAREPKSDASEQYFGQIKSIVEQYRIKGQSFVANSKSQNGWFTNFKLIVGPLGGMRSLSKEFPQLKEATELYAQQAKVGSLSDDDIECDLIKFQISALDKMLFVLQTDLKYLATEKPALINLAIARQLQEKKHVASHNYYDIKELTPAQRQLLRDFFLDRVDQAKVSVAESIVHFDEPSSFILGRIHDSCRALSVYTDIWRQLEPKHAEVCGRSKLTRKHSGQPAIPHQMDAFCKPFLDSL